MKFSNTKAFILKYYPFGTSHKLLIMFSFDLGKIKTCVYGAYKNPLKGSSFQILNLIEFNLSKSSKSDLYQILNFEFIKSPSLDSTKLSYTSIQSLYAIGEFIHQFIQEEDPHQELWINLNQIIQEAFADFDFFEIYILSFRLNSLYLLGFLPVFQTCFICIKSIQINQYSYIDLKKFHIYCSFCYKNMNSYSKHLIIKLEYKTYTALSTLYHYQSFYKNTQLKKDLQVEKDNITMFLKQIEKTIIHQSI